MELSIGHIFQKAASGSARINSKCEALGWVLTGDDLFRKSNSWREERHVDWA